MVPGSPKLISPASKGSGLRPKHSTRVQHAMQNSAHQERAHALPRHRHSLAVAFHVNLLDVGGKARQGLRIRQQSSRRVAEESGVPHTQQAQDHGQVLHSWRARCQWCCMHLSQGLTHLRKRRGEEVVVHRSCTSQELGHDVVSVLQRQRHHADRRAHTVVVEKVAGHGANRSAPHVSTTR